MSISGKVLVYGGSGALGRSLVEFFREKNYKVLNIDLVENKEAHWNGIVKGSSVADQWGSLNASLEDSLKNEPGDDLLDAIFCVAGGWAGGNAKNKNFLANSDLMFRQSVDSSLIAAHLAASYLKPGGLLTLTGAAPAAGPTPGMIGYGAAKAAVHHLTQSLAQTGEAGGGLPKDSKVVCLCPVTIDTPMNRSAMPGADFSTWTPRKKIAEQLHDYLTGKVAVESGKLIKVITHQGNTTFEALQ